MSYKVINVIDGDTFEVSPTWSWRGTSGSIVRANGYDTPEKGQQGYEEAKAKLKRLIEGKKVELKNFVDISYGRLVCDVYYNGKNIKEYFPEYQ